MNILKRASVTVLLLALFASCPLSAKSINWMTDYEAAKIEAKKESKPLFLFFSGSDWCHWCKKMDAEILSQPEFAELVGDTFIFVSIDFPSKKKLPEELKKQNDKLAKIFEVRGYPSVIVLDSNLNKLGKLGYTQGGPEKFVKKLNETLNAA